MSTMKTNLFSIIAVFAMLFISCNKDQKLISEVAGEYEIDKIINYSDGKSYEVEISSGTIFFQNCEMKDGIGSNCTGWYEIDGRAKVNFQYRTEKEDTRKIIRITNPTSFVEPFIIGYYLFEKKGSTLILSGIKGDTNGVSFSEYSDMEFSEK